VPASARPPGQTTSGAQVRQPLPDESAHDQSGHAEVAADPVPSDTAAVTAGAASSLPPGRWLLLIYRVPSEPSRLRATVWRRIKSLGAIYLQNSAAALPASVAAERSMRKLRSEILDMSGTAVLMSCEVLAGEADVRAAFQAARDDEYEEIVDKCADFIAGVNKEYVENHFSYAELEENEVDLVKLRTWLARIRERDVFGAAGLAQALSSLAECEEKLEAYAARVYAEEAEGH
jgi:Protein ChrB, N-terminal